VDAEESSDDEPLNNTATKDTDTKPAVKRETALPNQIESDAAMAKQMQAELDASSRGRERRTAAAPVKKKSKTTPKKKKKRSNSDVDDSDAEDKPKKKKGGGGAFNKELILRYVCF
jgi:upstream activation factor subunit UAF30